MKPLTLPSARAPIGTATVQGQRIDVQIGLEWFQALSQLVQRSGGTPGIDISGVPALVGQADSAPVAAPSEPQRIDDQLPTQAQPIAADDDPDSRLPDLEARMHRLEHAIAALQLTTTP